MSVLAAACSGRLTEDWRRNRGVLDTSWDLISFGDICLSSFYGPRFGRGEYVQIGIPTIRTTDMTTDGRIELRGDIPRVVVPESRLADFVLQKGDLLVTRTGSIGVMALFELDLQAIPSAYLIRFRLNKKDVIPRFALYSLLSPDGQTALGLGATAVTQPNINAQTIKAIAIKLPSMDEQIEIVRRAEVLLKTADGIESRYLKSKTFIDKLMPSVLAKALRGELV